MTTSKAVTHGKRPLYCPSSPRISIENLLGNRFPSIGHDVSSGRLGPRLLPSRSEFLKRLTVQLVRPCAVCAEPKDALIVLANGEQSNVLVAISDGIMGNALAVLSPNSLAIRSHPQCTSTIHDA